MSEILPPAGAPPTTQQAVSGFEATVRALLTQDSQCRDVFIEALKDFHRALRAGPAYDARFASDPSDARWHLDVATLTLGWLIHRLEEEPPEALDASTEQVQDTGHAEEAPQDAGADAGHGGRKVVPPSADRLLVEALREVHTELMRNPQLDSPIDALVPRGESPARPPTLARDYWRQSYMALLRLPDKQRREWHLRLTEAASRGVDPVHAPQGGALDNSDVLVPELPGHHHEERLSLWPQPDAPLPAGMEADLRNAAGLPGPSAGAEHRWWALRAHHTLRLIRLDPLLVFHWDEARQATDGYFRERLCEHLTSWANSVDKGWDARNRFRMLHDLDGVIGSVLHSTPAAHDSWWWRWRAAPRQRMADAAGSGGYEVPPRPEKLTGKQLREFTAGTMDVRGHSGASASILQWVLRAPARTHEGVGIGAVVIKPEPTPGAR